MSRRGYTVLELAVAMTLGVLITSLSIPHFVRARRNGELRRAAQSLVQDLGEARVLAASGRCFDAPWTATDHTRSAGIVIVDTESYYVFADRDGVTNGDEVIVKTVVLPPRVRISAPALGRELRVRPNGTIANVFDVVLADDELRTTRTVVITAGGWARVN